MMTEERWKVMQDRKRLEEAAEDLLAASERLLELLAEPNEIVREMGMDNAIQSLSDAIAKATGEPRP
jgi:hypothetical protein